jgi:hypothetical protein
VPGPGKSMESPLLLLLSLTIFAVNGLCVAINTFNMYRSSFISVCDTNSFSSSPIPGVIYHCRIFYPQPANSKEPFTNRNLNHVKIGLVYSGWNTCNYYLMIFLPNTNSITTALHVIVFASLVALLYAYNFSLFSFEEGITVLTVSFYFGNYFYHTGNLFNGSTISTLERFRFYW